MNKEGRYRFVVFILHCKHHCVFAIYLNVMDKFKLNSEDYFNCFSLSISSSI